MSCLPVTVRTSALSLILVLAVLMLPDAGSCLELHGTMGSDLYVWDRDDQTHVRLYESVLATLVAYRGSQARELTVHTDVRWVTDLGDKLSSDPQLFFRTMYLKLRGVPRRTEFRLGRQFVYPGVGNALLDGVRVRHTLGFGARLDLFTGSSVSRIDPENIRSYADFGTWGGRVSYAPGGRLRLGLGWIRREDGAAGTYGRLGIDAEYSEAGWRGYGRLAFNTARRHLADVLVRASRTSGPVFLLAEFGVREPSVLSSSIFSIVESRRYRELRLEGRRTLSNGWTIVAKQRFVFRQGTDTWQSAIGVRVGAATVGWKYRSGYGGSQNGIYANSTHQVHPDWTLHAAADISRYAVQAEQEGKSDAWMTRVGATWRPGRLLHVTLEAQHLRTATESDDVRLLVRMTRRFSVKRRDGGAAL